MASNLKIGFLGSGKMATALAKGFIQAGLVNAGDLMASDPIDGARASFAKDVGAKVSSSNPEVAQSANVLLLAVKPEQVAQVLADVRGHFTEKQLFISIAA